MAVQNINGSEDKFRTYRLGRFSVDVPVSINQVSTDYVVYYTNFEEFKWKDHNHIKERNALWTKLLSDIKTIRLPIGIKKIIIDEIDLTNEKYWAKGVFYYGNSDDEDAGHWDVLLDSGTIGVWIKVVGTVDKKDNMEKLLEKVIQAYHAPTESEKMVSVNNKNRFYFKYGAVDLPFKYREEIYTRFEGHPLDKFLKLEIEYEVVDIVEESNLIQRFSASLLADFAPGVEIDEIRSETRIVAGLEGDEVVFRGTASGDSNLNFAWRFSGEKDSETAPKILISMETKDGDLNAKLKLWDSVLDSFKPLGH
ncbi:hypothetical protein MNBD_GAMMA21-136 [hydrothermal vent metagenome]|uniref:Tle cognate immunity protein 4 C-terminal domain-containing protein n=1 Tax=hydrothermal vent metagenome TaxID=652676 RepID=A0A3B0ZX47_9ZZZZ